ncbi:hypothetical protein P389DRAFT_177059 [Cystobasidium minutum MCA 4210]|uniref:uncharacterized protein n=1 Tax=Cystobasidium minutum MCA 4210 TaxID=1397322 RepID=UPI0034CFA20A|eukprot:jgi/Rhomi1/177059/fgenesh1_pg.1_\
MYSPPAITSGTKYERSSSSTLTQHNTVNDTHHSAPENTNHHKLPSLPPFPSLVSSLGERREEEYAHPNSSKSSNSSSTLPPFPPPYYSQQQYHHRPSHSPSSVESATRSSFEPTNLYQDRSAIGRNHTSTPSGTTLEDRKPELPIPTGYTGSTLPFRSSTSQDLANMSGPQQQQVEWESSLRTGSSAANSEAPLSPSHPNNAKRRRLSAAHDVVHGSASAEDTHDDDDHLTGGVSQIDELSPNMGAPAHLPPLSHHQRNMSSTSMLNESASPPGGSNGQSHNLDEDEKGANGRTLKQTKRAAQNRAAQQAFRKRKEERIRELEEKEKVLNSLVARENEIMRRERMLNEREARMGSSAFPYSLNGPSSASTANDGGAASSGATAAGSTATNDWDRAFASAPVASPVQHIAERLESSNRTNDILKNEIDALKKQLQDKNALIESLRRSLEDLGAENRNLRDAVGRSSSSEARQQQQ